MVYIIQKLDEKQQRKYHNLENENRIISFIYHNTQSFSFCAEIGLFFVKNKEEKQINLSDIKIRIEIRSNSGNKQEEVKVEDIS